MNYHFCTRQLIIGTLSIFSIVFISSCKDRANSTETTKEEYSHIKNSNHLYYVTDIEFAHEKDRFFKNEVVCFNLDMTFGKNKSKMKIITATNSSSIRVDKMDGTSTIMSEGKVYTNADEENHSREKFGVYTYQYFFMMPYKMSDPGTRWQQLPVTEINGEKMDRAMLTFDKDTGDAPDDWYIFHSDKKSKLINYVGYIVTGGGKSQEEAEKSAHAIGYSKYEQESGFPIAKEWKFYKYNKEDGLGEQIGTGIIKNVEFMDNTDQFLALEEDGYVLIED